MKSRTIAYLSLSLAFLLLTNVAYLNYALHAKPGFRYTGANPYAAADKLVYMSLIEQGREGAVFMRNVHTTETKKSLMLSPHWYLIGQTAKLFNISNNTSYQLYRILFTVLFLGMLYVLLKQLLTRYTDRIMAALFVLFSGGFGWVYIVHNPEVLSTLTSIQKFVRSPIDLYVTEGNTLLNFSQSPLFSLSQLLLVLIVYLFIQFRDAKNMRWDILSGCIALFLVIIHPYDAPIIFSILGSWTVWYLYRTRTWLILKKFSIIALGSILGIVYNVYVALSDPVLAQWLEQNLVYSPPFNMYVWGYGLLLPLWLVGAYCILKGKRNHPWWILILIWSSVVWLLLYAPVTLNRRFINGFHIMLALVAFFGFQCLYQRCTRAWLKVLYISVVFVALLSHIMFFLVVSLYFDASVYSYGYYYVTGEEDQLISFLRSNTDKSDKLLMLDEKTPFTITSQINRLVYLGHLHQTPQSHLKEQALTWFTSDHDAAETLEQKERFLKSNGLGYIIVNRQRLDSIPAWLNAADFLKKVYTSESFTVYEVVQ